MGSASLSLRMMAFSTLCSTAVAATNSMRRRLFARSLEASGLEGRRYVQESTEGDGLNRAGLADAIATTHKIAS